MKGYLYEGLGNSFIICENIPNKNSEKIASLCNENNTDGMIYYTKENNVMEIYNKDGSKALMCGNGIRCLTNYIYDFIYESNIYNISTSVGVKNSKVISLIPFTTKINLGRPRLIKELNEVKSIKIDDKTFYFNAIFLTTYHIVIMVDKISDKLINQYAEKIYNHPLFKNKCNVTFCELIDYHHIKTLTYERGVGFTKSCATGAAASSYISYLLYNMSNKIDVIQAQGTLKITIDNDIYLQGESSFIKEIDIDE